MTTTAAITSQNPLTITIVTDQHELEIKGSLTATIGADSVTVPYDIKSVLHQVVLNDSSGHQWTVVSDDLAAPTSTVVIKY